MGDWEDRYEHREKIKDKVDPVQINVQLFCSFLPQRDTRSMWLLSAFRLDLWSSRSRLR